DSVTEIVGYTFSGCSALTGFTIPDSVSTIKSYAFFDCSNLTNLTIPSSVTTIEDYAFQICIKLSNITYEGTIEQWNSINKESYWKPILATVVHCADGDVAI
ncbi:MAG: leucine-rich repeat domain-containing protein, partial [Spirochaetales bacterium]|nr:leucine-rich repeat domain-containing protein [Spirochaetales bacterium]